MPRQGFEQTQKQTQSMVLAPQLRQSLKILQVPAMELRTAILAELEANPTLEELPYDDISIEEQQDGSEPVSSNDTGDTEFESESPPEIEQPAHESAEDLDFSNEFEVLERMGEDWQGYMNEAAGEIPYTSEDAQRRQYFFDSLTTDQSFQENLLEQARLVEEDPEIISALEYILGSLDDNGILTSNASDLALMAQLPLMAIQNAIKLLQGLDPPGIGAESIADCLLLQLKRKGLENSLAAKIIGKQWNLLLRRRIPEIARSFRVSVKEVEDAIAEIALLDPAPARRFSEDVNQVIEADVTVQKDENDEWQIILNNEYVPRLRISSEYKQLLARGKLIGKDRDYLQNQFRNGRFLISAIEQRQQTIEKITRKLLEFQAEFFEKGRAYLRPLTMNQVAESVGVHETTVSRAVSGKYIRSPIGLHDMKFFFTPGYQGQDGREVSNKSIKDRIARIIESETPSKPLSDQKIVEILKSEGITIARRTVAKYREELGILPTNLRRQYD
ncbi:RNA polymerase factor sigma-54 [Puniceicoccales bacterium CK1056]|uniref:RNA polymerase factor sigma-54 n=1 Tax=Oceanipulchritudo coccoides TaxID=2706888 RepID=A0A6B2M361_9BACT|nr:RNA polymerase factor sigma-54 [Oceanipulchritudo coccoides]NDV62534.1 RNA polymerase factor sigma-54 [Oceanipulchritudo coccoides]